MLKFLLLVVLIKRKKNLLKTLPKEITKNCQKNKSYKKYKKKNMRKVVVKKLQPLLFYKQLCLYCLKLSWKENRRRVVSFFYFTLSSIFQSNEQIQTLSEPPLKLHDFTNLLSYIIPISSHL